MSLIELPLPPGVWRNGSKREAKGRYYDCNLIRWKNGKLKPIGGWSNINSTVLDGTPRTLFPFVSLSGVKYLAIGTNETAYIVPGASNTPDEIGDITGGLSEGQSTGSSGLGYGAGPFNGTFISKTYTANTISVQASDNSFNDATASKDFTEYFTVGDFIEASGFTGGNTSYNKTYPNYHEVTAVSANKVTVATSLGNNVTAGDNFTLRKSRNYGAELFETTTPGLVNTAGIWSFDMLGKYLVGSLDSDGRILYWDSSTANTDFIVATVDSGDSVQVPINNASVLVSKEGHVFALGASGEYRKVMFSTQGNFFSAIASSDYWTPSSNNTAGSFDLETTGRILSGKKVGNRILVFTDADVHAIDYLGPPFVYSRRKIGDACGAVSKQSMAVVGSACYWMSSAGTFFMYDGVVRPLACEVSNYIKEDYNELQNSIVYANTLKENNEIWFWYASKDSDEINRYVIYNYAENWWSVGKLIRTAFTDSGVFTRPLAISANKKLYEHEFDRDTNTARSSSVSDPTTLTELSNNDRTLAFGVSSSSNFDTFAETGAVEIGLGERFANLKQFVTDSSAGTNAVTLEVLTANNPDSSESSTSTSLSTTGYTDIRASGRQMRLKVKAPFDQDFEINTLRADVTQGGKR